MQIIIVLGNNCDDIIKKRVDKAIQEFNSSPCDYFSYTLKEYIPCKLLLFSGGSSSSISEATRMKEYAMSRGIDQKFIIIEEKSKTTIENIINSEKMLRESPTFEITLPKITICTSSCHISRAMLISKFYFGQYDLSFIHTNEIVSEKERMRENKACIDFIESYSKQYIGVNFE